MLKKLIFLIIVFLAIIIFAPVAKYYWDIDAGRTMGGDDLTPPVEDLFVEEENAQQESSMSSNVSSSAPSKEPVEQMEVTIMVPTNIANYSNTVTEYVQVGGEDPLEAWEFEEKIVEVPASDDVFRASAQAAAEVFSPGGGPDKTEVEYLEVVDGTAYILLNIDLDGWAGVSVTRGIIHPLVEKTLLRFKKVNSVEFKRRSSS